MGTDWYSDSIPPWQRRRLGPRLGQALSPGWSSMEAKSRLNQSARSGPDCRRLDPSDAVGGGSFDLVECDCVGRRLDAVVIRFCPEIC